MTKPRKGKVPLDQLQDSGCPAGNSAEAVATADVLGSARIAASHEPAPLTKAPKDAAYDNAPERNLEATPAGHASFLARADLAAIARKAAQSVRGPAEYLMGALAEAAEESDE